MQAGRLKDAGKIGIKAGKVINKRKVGKHFITDIGDGRFGWRRDEDKIAAEAALDGIYVIRTSAAADKLGTGETVEAYKDLGNLERDFWSMKAEDIDLRPIYHYLENRVRSHVFLCMLATYLKGPVVQCEPQLRAPVPGLGQQRERVGGFSLGLEQEGVRPHCPQRAVPGAALTQLTHGCARGLPGAAEVVTVHPDQRQHAVAQRMRLWLSPVSSASSRAASTSAIASSHSPARKRVTALITW